MKDESILTNFILHPSSFILLKTPCTGVEPVSPARQAGRHTRCVTGPKQGRKESNPLKRLWRPPALPGARPCPSGRDRTRTCKGLRLVRFPTGCHHACWLALPAGAVPAGLGTRTVLGTTRRH